MRTASRAAFPVLLVLATALVVRPSRAEGEPDPDPAAGAKPASGAAALDVVRKAFLAKCRYAAGEYEVAADEPRRMGERLFLETVRFPSPVKSSDPERNDVVHAKLFRVEKPEPAAAIFLGGWRRDPLTPNLAARFAETGAVVLLIDLPFQGDRTPKDRKSGELTLSADLDQNEATFVQVAQDIARAADWLVRERKVDPKRIALFGTSLGGFVAANLYGMDDRWAGAAVQLAGADVASVLFNGNVLTRRIRDALVAKGVDEAQVRARLASLDPATWARPERKAGLLLLAAEADEIVPLEKVKSLAEAWGGAKLLTLPGATHFSAPEIAAKFPDLEDHLAARLGLRVETPAPATK